MLDPYAIVDRTAELGYQGLELAPFTLSEDLLTYPAREQRALSLYAQDRGVELLGLHWLLRSPSGLHIASNNRDTRKRTVDFFFKVLEIATNTGAKVLTLGSPKQRSFENSVCRKEAVKRAVDFLSLFVPALESEEMILSLEPLETEFTNFLNRTEEAVELAETIGSRSIGITLDTHFLRWEKQIHGTSIRDAFRIAGKRLVHLHIQDDNRKAPGMGRDDFSEFIAAVNEIGWNRYISMETFICEVEAEAEEIARQGIGFLNRHFS
jgi:sugar phosphate isomerase/epimerase